MRRPRLRVGRVRLRRRSGRTPGWAYILVLLLMVSVVAGIPYAIAGKDARRPPLEAQLTNLTLPPGIALTDLKEARVERVVDGDTIDVTLDGALVRVRYYGVDTPERGGRCFREATDRNEILIGKAVRLLPDARNEDGFGRLLRYIFTADGVSVDATLVAEGFGLAWRDDGRYRQEIVALENEAQHADRGCLWK